MDFRIDEERCTQCGLCVVDCPVNVLTQEKDETPRVGNDEKCIKCQHCLAVCPTGALSIFGVDPDASLPLKGKLPTQEQMEALIKGRRSVRSFKQEDVEPDVLRQLLDTVWHAPTGTNSQKVLFTVLDKRETTDRLREDIYSRLIIARETREIEDRPEMNFLGWAAKVYAETGNDVIFRGAPHVLIASAGKSSASPLQDAHIALSYFDLMAPTMGIGTLWNGMVTWAVRDIFPELAGELGIPEDHVIAYAMVFGKPKVKYARCVQRGPANVNYASFF